MEETPRTELSASSLNPRTAGKGLSCTLAETRNRETEHASMNENEQVHTEPSEGLTLQKQRQQWFPCPWPLNFVPTVSGLAGWGRSQQLRVCHSLVPCPSFPLNSASENALTSCAVSNTTQSFLSSAASHAGQFVIGFPCEHFLDSGAHETDPDFLVVAHIQSWSEMKIVLGGNHLNSQKASLSFCLVSRARASCEVSLIPKHTHKLVSGFSPLEISSCPHRNKLLRITENKRQHSKQELDNCLHSLIDSSGPTS